MAPYYERARAFLDLPSEGGWNAAYGWTAEGLEAHYGSPCLNYYSEHFDQIELVIRPVRMGEQFHKPLKSSRNIDVVLNSNVVEIEVDDTGESARGVRVITLSGRRFSVDEKMVVIAAGGLENVRLLLSSTSVRPNGLGNQNDLVGRFFADHINLEPGHLIPNDPAVDLSLYQRRDMTETTESAVWHELSPAAQKLFELVPCSVRLMSRAAALNNSGGRSLKKIVKEIARGKAPADPGAHLMNIMAEVESISAYAAQRLWYGRSPVSKVAYEMSLAPAPNPDSRVSLSGETDKLGMQRLKLDWRLSEIDFRTIRWAASTFVDEAAANGFGRTMLELENETLSEKVRWTWHHMCTTRMSSAPGEGVVDSDYRIHSKKNLYVAGSSVFSTSG
ncbi:GMC oxidoreductase [Candidatus Halocynthiibacter alkanivorans]|uniref:GMC oxidoreductase n=1 Tax=Candidatus Halocynthiibacter alkanivorans TaxID=2267619 RepID=UPI000DF499BE|nr:GMC oxidoreductase [Candidatus Halocynthiibacter alkanivorans]